MIDIMNGIKIQKIALIMELFEKESSAISNLQTLNDIRVKYLGKKGDITSLMSEIKDISGEQKKEFGYQVNLLREFVVNKIEDIKNNLETAEINKKLASERIDITLPGHDDYFHLGKKHPVSATIDELKNIMHVLGFEGVNVEEPEIEGDWHNFTALNIAKNHPARQMHDTFYIDHESVKGFETKHDGTNSSNSEKKDSSNLLLRTHTSSVQIRHMLKNKPPIRIFSLGKVYRSDYDATHTPMFHQIEGLYIDKHVTFADLKACLQKLLQLFFEVNEVPMRFRANYFPFTEPSAEVDIQCDKSKMKSGEGISIGKGNDWMEILGCGMVHPNVLSNVGIDPNQYQGFAFGIGIERLTMLKHNITDLRALFENDMRWIRYYGTV